MKKTLLILCSAFVFLFATAFTANANQTGDVDGNGIIQAADARLVLRQAVGLADLQEDEKLAADVDANDSIQAADARQILRVSVGLDQFTGDFTISFIDVGQADSIFIACDDETMLIDGGNVADGPAVCSFLYSQGVETLDYVVCTHAHEDHVGGLTDVLESFTVTDAVFAPSLTNDTLCYRNFTAACRAQNQTPVAPRVGSAFELGESTVTVLGPALQNNTDLNNSSIVLLIQYGDTSFLLTGDAEAEAEKAVTQLGADLSATLFKAGHHGSYTSNSYDLLQEVMPEFAVISCGTDNEYGHPHEEVLSRFGAIGITVYRTDLQGTVSAVSNGKTLSFTTVKNEFPSVPSPDPDIPSEPEPEPEPEPASEYIGNINSHIFHVPTCSSLPAEKNRIYFTSRATAVQNGYTPCSRCKP